MTKKTKKALLWAVGIWCVLCIISAVIYGPSEENTPAQPQTEEVLSVKTIYTKDDAALMRFKMLYNKLLSFKDSRDFHSCGFGKGGDFHGWYMAVHNFTKEDDNYLLRTYGFVSGDLLMLAQEYLNSKGKETNFSQSKRKEFDNVLSCETWEVSE